MGSIECCKKYYLFIPNKWLTVLTSLKALKSHLLYDISRPIKFKKFNIFITTSYLLSLFSSSKITKNSYSVHTLDGINFVFHEARLDLKISITDFQFLM